MIANGDDAAQVFHVLENGVAYVGTGGCLGRSAGRLEENFA